MTTPGVRDYRLAKNEYVVQSPTTFDLGAGGRHPLAIVPFKSRCRAAILNLAYNQNLTADTELQPYRNLDQIVPSTPIIVPNNTGPTGDGDQFVFLDWKSDPVWSAGVDALFMPGDSICIRTDGLTAGVGGRIAWIMVREEGTSSGLVAMPLYRKFNQSIDGEFEFGIVMNRDVVIHGLYVNAHDSPDNADTYTIKINGTNAVDVDSNLYQGIGTTDPANFRTEYVRIRNLAVAKYDLIEINHDGASTGTDLVNASLLMSVNGPMNESCTSVGKAVIQTPGINLSDMMVVTEPSIVKGIVIHTDVTTDAIDIWKLRINGYIPSNEVRFPGTNGLAANTGEFIPASRRVEVIPGDRLQLLQGGESSGPGTVHASLVIGT